MKKFLGEIFSSADKGKPKLGKSFTVGTVLICLGISVLGWLLLSLERTYTYQLRVPVNYENLRDEIFLKKVLPTKCMVELNATGFSLLYLKLKTGMHPLVLDMQEAGNNRTETEEIHIALHDPILGLFEELSSRAVVLRTVPDTLYINLSKKASRKIKVQHNDSISFEKNHFQEGEIEVIPDSISVYGPSNILDSLRFVSTQTIVARDLTRPLNKKVKLLIPEQLYCDPSVVRVKLNVEKYTQFKQKVKIGVKNFPKNKKILLYPSQVEVSYLVPVNAPRKSSDIRIYADFSGIPERKKGSAVLKIDSTFATEKGMILSPPVADFIILDN